MNRICSDNSNIDKQCNELKYWLLEKGCNKNIARKQILRAREHSRESLLEKIRSDSDHMKVTFNIFFYPDLQILRNILQKLHVLLMQGNERKNVFSGYSCCRGS